MTDDMDKRRKDQADKIITELTEKNPSDTQSIEAQRKANKELLGHEGEVNLEKH